MAICESTEGMRGISLGQPHTDNWIGQLQAEYAKSETSIKQGFRLPEWFIKKIKLLIINRGNQDTWSGPSDSLEYIHKAVSMHEQCTNGCTAVLGITHDCIDPGQFHSFQGQVRQARVNNSGNAADLVY